MGLFGGGDVNTTTNQYTTNENAEINPQVSFATGSVGPQVSALVAPTVFGDFNGNIATTTNTNYAPLNVLTTGDNYGDTALNSLTKLAGIQQSPATAGGTGIAATVSNLFSGSAIYWILGAIVFLHLAHHK